MFDSIKRASDDRACDIALSAIASGDRSKLEVIYEKYGRMVLSVARGIVGDGILAEDILQDVLLAVLMHSTDYSPGSDPRAWVMALARNRALDILRKREKECPHEFEASARSGDPLTSVRIRHAFEALDADERMLIRLKLDLGFSHKEIAAVLGISVDAAKKRYGRALAKFRENF